LEKAEASIGVGGRSGQELIEHREKGSYSSWGVQKASCLVCPLLLRGAAGAMCTEDRNGLRMVATGRMVWRGRGGHEGGDAVGKWDTSQRADLGLIDLHDASLDRHHHGAVSTSLGSMSKGVALWQRKTELQERAPLNVPCNPGCKVRSEEEGSMVTFKWPLDLTQLVESAGREKQLWAESGGFPESGKVITKQYNSKHDANSTFIPFGI
jgi:hypothetical protein